MQEPGEIASPHRRLQTMLTQCNDQTKYEIIRIRGQLLTFEITADYIRISSII